MASTINYSNFRIYHRRSVSSSKAITLADLHHLHHGRCAVATSHQALATSLRHGRRATVAMSSPEDKVSNNSAFDIVFGKPSAPKELYERIAKESSEVWGPHGDQAGGGR